jgi:hypothetical protein
MLLTVGMKKKTACAVFFLAFDLSKAELSLHLLAFELQKKFTLSDRTFQYRSEKYFLKNQDL